MDDQGDGGMDGTVGQVDGATDGQVDGGSDHDNSGWLDILKKQLKEEKQKSRKQNNELQTRANG